MSDQTTMERRPPTAAPDVWSLVPVHSGGQVCAPDPIELPRAGLCIGRSPGVGGWALPQDPMLSRRHATVGRVQGGLLVTDLSSRNGTWVDGQPVDTTGATAPDGSVLRLADTFFVVRRRPSTPEPDASTGGLGRIRGDAPAIRALRRAIARVGPGRATVLLLGASGTGKGLAARALHQLSGRAGPLVQVNCAAIPEALAESAFFGHRRGAFTGATAPAEGYFRAAHGGTLFVDEVGDLPLPLQAKLLHAVEEGVVVPVGDTRPHAVDVRIVAATAVDLYAAEASGAFRGDLLARLAGMVVRLPALAERREDILGLLLGFSPGLPTLHPDLVSALLLHPWRFNVRELEQVGLALGLVAAETSELNLSHLEGRLAAAAGGAAGHTPAGPPLPAPARVAPPDAVGVRDALARARGNISEAARLLGRSRRQLYRDLARLEIDPEGFR